LLFLSSLTAVISQRERFVGFSHTKKHAQKERKPAAAACVHHQKKAKDAVENLTHRMPLCEPQKSLNLLLLLLCVLLEAINHLSSQVN
jgi:hypothetical protein